MAKKRESLKTRNKYSLLDKVLIFVAYEEYYKSIKKIKNPVGVWAKYIYRQLTEEMWITQQTYEKMSNLTSKA